jgi:hypothetical protein
MRHAGLELVGQISGAEHAMVYQRVDMLNQLVFDFATKQAKLIGPLLNCAKVINDSMSKLIKENFANVWRKFCRRCLTVCLIPCLKQATQ